MTEVDRAATPLLEWLGLRSQPARVGVHITSDWITLAAMRAHPLRLVAIGRAPVVNAAVVGNEIRLTSTVTEALAGLVADARLTGEAVAVAAVEPLANSFSMWEQGSDVLVYNVAESTFNRIDQVCSRAGLPLERVDLVPAAMARLGRVLGVGTVAGRAPNGWTVNTGGGFADAARSDHGAPTGPPLRTLAGIGVPRRLGPVVDPAGDAVAIGAALAGFNHEPIVSTQPAADAIGPDWIVEHVGSPDEGDDEDLDPGPWLSSRS